MQSCKITTSWLDLLLASVEVEKYKNWFNPKHWNQALCTEGKWEKNLTQFMLIWFSTMFSLFIDFQQTLCGCWTDLLQRLEFPRSTVVLQICTKTDGFGWKSTQSVQDLSTKTKTNTKYRYKYKYKMQICAKMDGFGWESTQSVQGLSATAFRVMTARVPAPLAHREYTSNLFWTGVADAAGDCFEIKVVLKQCGVAF